MPSMHFNMQGVQLQTLSRNLSHERVEFSVDDAQYPNLNVGDIVTVAGQHWAVVSLTLNTDRQGNTRKTVVAQDLISTPREPQIRSSVRARRKAARSAREQIAEKWPGISFSPEFVYNMIALAGKIGQVAVMRMMTERLAAAGAEDDQLSAAAERAAKELTEQIGETLLLWPGVAEGKPFLPHADK